MSEFNADNLESLCRELRRLSETRQDRVLDWPAESLRLCGRFGVFRGLCGQLGWTDAETIRCYLALSRADLTTTFVITQFMGACRRIMGSNRAPQMSELVEELLAGQRSATVGISHLTTSRRHLASPVLGAEATANGFRLDGYSPWVTGAPHADFYVVGATLPDRTEILACVPRSAAGVVPSPGLNLVALTSSCTDRVDFQGVEIAVEAVLAGPMENVMASGVGAGTGGLQTSTLAIGLAGAACEYLEGQGEDREDLRPIAREFRVQVTELENELMLAASGGPTCSAAELRGRANRLVLRATQAALTAAKGAGYVEGHAVGRWCREAMFFLVWSCPQPVANNHLCELAGLES